MFILKKIIVTIFLFQLLFSIHIYAQSTADEKKTLPPVKTLRTVTITGQAPIIERRADKIIVNLNNMISAGSVMDVMNQLPGVQVNPDEQISLNGRTVRIYIDGKATPLSSEALSSLLKGMSPSGVQKIELIANPSAKYDAGGSGGIINIVRKRNHKEGLNGNVYGGAGIGEYGKNSGGLNLNYKSAGYNLFLNSDYSFNKYFVNSDLRTVFLAQDNLPGDQTVSRINSIRKNRTYTPSLGLDLYLSKKSTLSLSATQGLQWFDKDANSNTSAYNTTQTKTGQTSFLNLVNTNSNNFSSGVHLLHQIDTAGKEYTIDLDYYRYSNNSDQHNTNTVYNPEGGLISGSRTLFDQDRRFSIYSAKADYTHPLKDKGNLEAGWKSSYVLSNNSNQVFDTNGNIPVPDGSQNDFFKYQENISSVYINYSKTYKKLSYQVGIRGENTWGRGEQVQTAEIFNRNYFQLFPSAFLDYKFDEKNGLNISVNKNTDRPTYENLNPLIRIINSTTYLQGNPNLKPVNSYNSSVNYSYRNAFFATFSYSLNLHDFTYLTSAYDDSGITTTRPDNNRNTQLYRLILTYTKQVKPWWFTSTGITMAQQSFKGRDNTADLNSPGVMAFNFDTYDSFNLSKNFAFLVLFRYRGKSMERNITNDPYFIFTTGVRQTLFGGRGTLALNVTDVFHSYKVKYVQNSADISQYWNNHNETTIGRLNFTYNFGGKIKKQKTAAGAEEEKRRTTINEN